MNTVVNGFKRFVGVYCEFHECEICYVNQMLAVVVGIVRTNAPSYTADIVVLIFADLFLQVAVSKITHRHSVAHCRLEFVRPLYFKDFVERRYRADGRFKHARLRQ